MAQADSANATPERWAKLWTTVRPDGPPHALDTAVLGEYAIILQERGPEVAGRDFPAVVDHLATDCGLCAADLQELLAFAAEEQRRTSKARTALRWRYGVQTDSAGLPLGPSRLVEPGRAGEPDALAEREVPSETDDVPTRSDDSPRDRE
jgi:hypothetical protein